MCWSLRACNFIIKKTPAHVFFCEFCKILKNTFIYRTTPVATSELSYSLNYLYSSSQIIRAHILVTHIYHTQVTTNLSNPYKQHKIDCQSFNSKTKNDETRIKTKKMLKNPHKSNLVTSTGLYLWIIPIPIPISID